MRIGFFTDTFLPQRNGVVTSVVNSGAELVKRGHEVHVFCPKTGVKGVNGISVHSYPAVKFRPYPEFQIAVPKGRDKAPPLDIVHTHSPFTMGFFGWRVAKFQGIPKVSTFHTLLSEYSRHLTRIGKPFVRFLTWELCKIFYNRHKKLIAPSGALKKVLRAHGIRKPIQIIPNGIDLSFYRPIDRQEARRSLGLQGGRIFLCLGRISHEKNLDSIVRAFKGVNARLLIVGRGPAEPGLKELVKGEKLQRKIFFKGFVSENLKRLYYSAADALLIASTSETQGLVIVEAMACGTPVIGADALAIPEIVKDGRNGYIFKPGDEEHLAKILSEFEFNSRLRKNALKTSRRFSIEECVTKLEKFYDRLI
jgi:glycosyltransferase involved in cell wall biosynthesis